MDRNWFPPGQSQPYLVFWCDFRTSSVGAEWYPWFRCSRWELEDTVKMIASTTVSSPEEVKFFGKHTGRGWAGERGYPTLDVLGSVCSKYIVRVISVCSCGVAKCANGIWSTFLQLQTYQCQRSTSLCKGWIESLQPSRVVGELAF